MQLIGRALLPFSPGGVQHIASSDPLQSAHSEITCLVRRRAVIDEARAFGDEGRYFRTVFLARGIVLHLITDTIIAGVEIPLQVDLSHRVRDVQAGRWIERRITTAGSCGSN